VELTALTDEEGEDVSSTKRQARTAGFLYLLLVGTAPPGLLYVPGKLIVSGDAAATANNLRASEGLLRLGIASELIHQVLVVFLVLALYRLFKPVSAGLARQVVILGALLSVPIMFLNVLNDIAAQILASGPDYLSSVFAKPQLDALAYLALRLHGEGFTLASVFWGLWLFPFGMLVYRSGFLPRTIGVFLMIGCVSILTETFCSLVFPESYGFVSQFTAIPSALGEFSAILWFLIFGAKESSPVTAGVG
jgi:hypothetical protein